MRGTIGLYDTAGFFAPALIMQKTGKNKIGSLDGKEEKL